MSFDLEASVIVLVTTVIIYSLYGLIISYSWNHSVRVIIPGTPEIGIWNALMLVFTLHILFGGINTTFNSIKNA